MSRLLLSFALGILLTGAGNYQEAGAGPTLDEKEVSFAYILTDHPESLPKVNPQKFDQVKSGMTLGKIVDLLGKGWVYKYLSGTGIIRWQCADGRVLCVWPASYRKDEIITTKGAGNGLGRMWVEKKTDQ